jgi:hypothetical protein
MENIIKTLGEEYLDEEKLKKQLETIEILCFWWCFE